MWSARLATSRARSAPPATGAPTYRWPFQLHASIGPSCAVADVRGDAATVYSATQGAHQLVAPIAALLACRARTSVSSSPKAPGATGTTVPTTSRAMRRSSQAVGRPVRVQWSREDEHGWEPEGPAMLFEMAGAIGADGKISAWTYDAWTPTHGSRPTRDPATLVAGALAPEPRTPASSSAAAASATPRRNTSCLTNARRRTRSRRSRSARRRSAGSVRHRTRSRTSLSWTSWRRPPASTRSSFGGVICPIRERWR